MFVPGSSIPYDMGTYYMHALVHLLGPIKRVAGFARKYPTTFTNPRHPNYKEQVDVSGSTTISTSLEFHNGVFGNLTVTAQSFIETPRIEIYGTEGTLICPDPNTYGGPVLLMRKGGTQFYEFPITHEYVTTNKPDMAMYGFTTYDEKRVWADSRRGIGVADMAWAIRNNRPHRCTADIDLHAMEVIYGVEQCSQNGGIYTMTTKPDQPAALPAGKIGADAESALDN
jgi:predicted dehydrogenase